MCKATTTHDGCWRRWWASPRYPPSIAIPLSIGLGINVLALRIIFINPLRVLLLQRSWGLRVLRDSAAGRSVVSHIVWEFFFAM